MNINGIIFFGDSIFFGYGATNKKKGCARLFKNNNKKIKVLIKAKNRDTSFDALERINQDVLSRKDFSHVFILFGNNDCRLIDINTPIISLVQYKRNMKKIVQYIIENDKIPILCNLQPIDNKLFYKTLSDMVRYINFDFTPDQWHKQYSDIIYQISKEMKILFLDINTYLRQFGEKIFAKDGLHPNDIGHQFISECIEKKINKIKKI